MVQQLSQAADVTACLSGLEDVLHNWQISVAMFPGAVTPEVILSSRASYRFAPLLRQDLRMYSTAGTHWLGIRIRVICQLSFWPDGALVLPQRWPDFWLGIWAVSPTPILSFYLIPSVLDPQVI